MFGIGALEFFLIAVLALLVLGPKDLPNALYQLGKAMRKMRKFSSEIQSGFDKITEDVELEEIAKEANKVGDELTDFRVEQQAALEARDKKKPKTKSKKKTPKKTAIKKVANKK